MATPDISDLPVPSQTSAAAPSAPDISDLPVPPSAPTSWGRAAGLDARSLLTGAAGLAAFGANAIGNASDVEDVPGTAPEVTSAAPTAPYQGPQLSDFVHPERWQQAAEYFADKAGLPRPQTPGERVSSAAVSALPALVATPEADVAEAPAALSNVGRIIDAGKYAATQTAKVAAPVMASGAASQEVAEQGGTPGEQLAAGLVVGGLPAIATGGASLARRIVSNPEETSAALASADRAGVNLTAGQATGSKLLQKGEAVSRAMWGGGPINAALVRQHEALGSKVDGIVSNLAGGETPSPTTAGEAIQTGAKQTQSDMRAAERAAYDKVDNLVPGETPINVSNTVAKLDDLGTPTPGAEATTGSLIPKTISTLRDNIATDAKDGTLPYSAVRALRTRIGNSIDWGFAPADPTTNGALKQVYGALTDDLNAGASAVSDDAKAAVDDANSTYAGNQTQRAAINQIVNKAGGPEAIYTAATSGVKGGASKISGVLSVMNPAQRNLVRATVLDRLGRAVASQQDEIGSQFSAETFLTRWNQMSPEAKDALFGKSGSGAELRDSLDGLTKTMARLRESGALKNPSGSGNLLGHVFQILGDVGEVGAATMNHHGIAGAALAASMPAANWLSAKYLLTNPRFVRWLAKSMTLPRSALPVAVSQLAASRDPMVHEFANKLGDATTRKPGASPETAIKIQSPEEAAGFPVGTHVRLPDGSVHVRRVYKRP